MAKNTRTAYGFSSPNPQMAPLSVEAQRAPTTADTNFDIGTPWINVSTNQIYFLTSVDASGAQWRLAASGTTDFEDIIPDSGTSPIVPDSSGSVTFAGANGIQFVGGSSTLTATLDTIIVDAGADFNIVMGDAIGGNFINFQNATPATVASIDSTGGIIAPALTTQLLAAGAGNDLTITMGDAAGANKISFSSITPAEVASIDSNGAFISTVSMQAPLVTAGAGNNLTLKMGDNAGANRVVFTDSDDASVGALTSDGNLSVAQNVEVTTAGFGLEIAEGANARMGIVTLVAGAATVNTTAVTANSRIFLTHQTNAGTPGFVSVTARTPATSFTITSGNLGDTSDIAWMIVEPA